MLGLTIEKTWLIPDVKWRSVDTSEPVPNWLCSTSGLTLLWFVAAMIKGTKKHTEK